METIIELQNELEKKEFDLSKAKSDFKDLKDLYDNLFKKNEELKKTLQDVQGDIIIKNQLIKEKNDEIDKQRNFYWSSKINDLEELNKKYLEIITNLSKK